MQAERWQQIEQMFHSALERRSHERVAYLHETSGGDLELQREVESLLGAYEASGRLETAASDLAEEWLKGEQLLVGHALNHFRILAHLGSGGMGDVYLAEDNRLHRNVALKLLSSHFTGDADRLRRFEQEARAASSLNHPNILTIYEIGHTDSVRYIATEFIDGVTLRERMTERPMKTGAALDVAIQVASALAAAHAKGIVHRDIKPENIMISRSAHLGQRENYIKVLDFGIAKLTEPDVLETDLPTRPLVSTSDGITMGTAPYMSPEQAQGLKVDVRTQCVTSPRSLSME